MQQHALPAIPLGIEILPAPDALAQPDSTIMHSLSVSPATTAALLAQTARNVPRAKDSITDSITPRPSFAHALLATTIQEIPFASCAHIPA